MPAPHIAQFAAQYGLTTAATLPPRPKPKMASGEWPVASGEVHHEPQPTTPHSPLPTHGGAPAPPAPEYVDATPRRPRRSPQEIEAEARLGAHWVTLLSIAAPVPRRFGDNVGMLPVWVESNADWRDAGVKFDLQQPHLRAVRLEVIGVPSAAHAARLKAVLEEALAGRETQSGADGLRHGHRFRNAVGLGPLEDWWAVLLADVLMQCGLEAAEFTTFGRAEHEAAIAAAVARRAKVRP